MGTFQIVARFSLSAAWRGNKKGEAIGMHPTGYIPPYMINIYLIMILLEIKAIFQKKNNLIVVLV
ncbi:MAG: hypothetical protein BGP13_06440 [Sphingobacteriales bacterium 40-81]|nr:MAG: hypothetical protein BGP13_06440 [Sphingobacteriales bacterium 40-81]